jgi:hypothetical protein
MGMRLEVMPFEGSWHDSYPPMLCVVLIRGVGVLCFESRRPMRSAHGKAGHIRRACARWVSTPFLAARCTRVHRDYVRVAFSTADSRATRDRSCRAPPLAHLGARRPRAASHRGNLPRPCRSSEGVQHTHVGDCILCWETRELLF